MFHYPYPKTRDALTTLAKSGDVDPYHGIKMEYINPATGGPSMPTLGTYMQHLPKGFTTETYRSTAAWVYSPAEGTDGPSSARPPMSGSTRRVRGARMVPAPP